MATNVRFGTYTSTQNKRFSYEVWWEDSKNIRIGSKKEKIQANAAINEEVYYCVKVKGLDNPKNQKLQIVLYYGGPFIWSWIPDIETKGKEIIRFFVELDSNGEGKTKIKLDDNFDSRFGRYKDYFVYSMLINKEEKIRHPYFSESYVSKLSITMDKRYLYVKPLFEGNDSIEFRTADGDLLYHTTRLLDEDTKAIQRVMLKTNTKKSGSTGGEAENNPNTTFEFHEEYKEGNEENGTLVEYINDRVSYKELFDKGVDKIHSYVSYRLDLKELEKEKIVLDKAIRELESGKLVAVSKNNKKQIELIRTKFIEVVHIDSKMGVIRTYKRGFDKTIPSKGRTGKMSTKNVDQIAYFKDKAQINGQLAKDIKRLKKINKGVNNLGKTSEGVGLILDILDLTDYMINDNQPVAIPTPWLALNVLLNIHGTQFKNEIDKIDREMTDLMLAKSKNNGWKYLENNFIPTFGAQKYKYKISGIAGSTLSKLLNNEFLDYNTMNDFNWNEIGENIEGKVEYYVLSFVITDKHRNKNVNVIDSIFLKE